MDVPEGEISEGRIDAAKDSVQQAVADLPRETQQNVLLSSLLDSASEGMTDKVLHTLTQALTAEQRRRDESKAAKPSPEDNIDSTNEEAREAERIEEITQVLADETVKEKTELEAKAEELARITRLEGEGFLSGKFPRGFYQDPGQIGSYQSIRAFGYGKTLENDDDIKRYFPPTISENDQDLETAGTQIWTISDHKDFQGKATGLIQYQYYMPTPNDYDLSWRPGCFVRLSVSVPQSIATKLDAAVAENPLFPDKYFQALYPGLVGEDTNSHIRRSEAKNLIVRDLRKNHDPNDRTIMPYSQPIPY
ncbi:MAG TPA: hypothetical protein VLE95_07255 [Chlamydiales bacterium]|nr:hypothetical protein [Chlamydiales bacterium]